jgi:hypothetical protein
MAKKDPRKIFKEMVNLCYNEEDFPQLHSEILSLEHETKKNKEYEITMQQLIDIIPVFSEDFPIEIFSEIERLYAEYLED